MTRPPLIWLMLTLHVNFQIMVELMKSDGCVPLLNILRNKVITKRQSVTLSYF